jgi:hypothetical protein
MLELSRRNLIIAGAVTGAVLVSGVRSAVAVPPITESPLFVPHDKTLVLGFRDIPVIGTDSYPRLCLQLIRRTYEEGVPVASIVEAEDLMFAQANDLHLDNILNSHHMIRAELKRRWARELFDSRADPDKMMAHVIRASNRIGFVSKRGFGNHVLMRPDMLAKLQASLRRNGSDGVIMDVEPTIVGRWTRVAATATSPMQFYVGNALPPQDIVVFYRNTGMKEVIDGPAALIRNPEGRLSLYTIETMPSNMDRIYRFTLPV